MEICYKAKQFSFRKEMNSKIQTQIDNLNLAKQQNLKKKQTYDCLFLCYVGKCLNQLYCSFWYFFLMGLDLGWSHEYDVKLYPVVWLQFWNSWECGVTLSLLLVSGPL